jgi:nitronate monooxygenase
MRAAGQKEGDVHRMQAWAGHAAALAKAEQVADVVRKLWESRLRRSWRDAAVSG